MGDVIARIGDYEIQAWDDVQFALRELGPGPAELLVVRGGRSVSLAADLGASDRVEGSGYMGVRPDTELVDIGPFQGVGIAGRLVVGGVADTLTSLGQMVRPSSLAEYFNVFTGDTDVPDEIRPVSFIGIVSIGTQADGAASFFAIMAFINVILATLNFFPLLPLDGGHFAIALYEKVTRRQADVRRLIPIAVAVFGALIFLNLVAVILDVVNPLRLRG